MRAAMFFAMLLGSCLLAPAQTSPGVSAANAPDDSTTSDTPTAFDNVVLASADLAAQLTIVRAGANRTDANLLSVFVGLKNKTAGVLRIEVQTIYKNDAGQAMSEGTGNWIPIKLKPHEETLYRSQAISEDASDFLVRIRRAAPPTGGA